MQVQHFIYKLYFAASLLLCGYISKAQYCSPDVLALIHQSNAACPVLATLNTPNNEILLAGMALQVDGGFDYDGWISKLSERGFILRFFLLYSAIFIGSPYGKPLR